MKETKTIVVPIIIFTISISQNLHIINLSLLYVLRRCIFNPIFRQYWQNLHIHLYSEKKFDTILNDISISNFQCETKKKKRLILNDVVYISHTKIDYCHIK
jgi:hypothetical protein